jgi:hypothetical protein
MTARRPNATPSERLAVELNRAGVHLAAGYCAKAGIGIDDLRRAITGKQVPVNAFLRLCAVMRWDPCPELAHPMIEPGDFNALAFAMAFHIKRGLRGHDYEEAGLAMGVKPATVRRIEYGDPTSVAVMIRAARYAGLHPFLYVNALKYMPKWHDVSRETVAPA